MAAPTAAQFIAEEKKFLGVPYASPGDPPNSFDCSSLVQYSLNAIGIQGCPRTSEQQWSWCEKVSYEQLAPGMLVFEQWQGDDAPPGHVVTYLGNGQVIEAPKTGESVHIRPWSPTETTIVGYGRAPGLDMSGPSDPPEVTSNPPAATVTPGGTAYVFWKGTGGDQWQAWGPAGQQLQGPFRQDYTNLDSAPAVGVDSSNRTYTYWRGTDGNLWGGWWNNGWQAAHKHGFGPLG